MSEQEAFCTLSKVGTPNCVNGVSFEDIFSQYDICIPSRAIKEHCLDKARVREAIMLTIQNECACPDDSECGSCHSLRLLYKRLGL